MKILAHAFVLFLAFGLTVAKAAERKISSDGPVAKDVKVEVIQDPGANNFGYRLVDTGNGVVCYALQSGVSCVKLK